MAPLHQLWRHRRTGEVYAVLLDGTTVKGACGPLDCIEQRRDLLRSMPYEAEPGAAIDGDQTSYVLASEPPMQRTTLRWGWKELQRWLYHNRPNIGLATVAGVRGYYNRTIGRAESFVPCGYTWLDVARRVGAIRYK